MRVGSGSVFVNIIYFEEVILLITVGRIGLGRIGSKFFINDASCWVGFRLLWVGSGHAMNNEPTRNTAIFYQSELVYSEEQLYYSRTTAAFVVQLRFL